MYVYKKGLFSVCGIGMVICTFCIAVSVNVLATDNCSVNDFPLFVIVMDILFLFPLVCLAVHS